MSDKILRDIIAIVAMQAEITSNSGIIRVIPTADSIAIRAYALADAMMKKREKTHHD